MANSSMELKLVCCKDLKAFNFFQKLTVYALVSIARTSGTKPLQQHRTPTDKDGDGNPEWNHEIRFDLSQISSPDHHDPKEEDNEELFLHVHLRHRGAVFGFGDKTIGQVRVPIKDLIEESNGVMRFFSYQVRNVDGKPNGVLTFSCRSILSTTDKIQIQIQDRDHHSPDRIQYPPIEVEVEEKIRYPIVESQSHDFFPPPRPESNGPWAPERDRFDYGSRANCAWTAGFRR